MYLEPSKKVHRNLSAWSSLLFLSPGLAWQTCLKKVKIELDLLTDKDMLLMVEKGFRAGACHAIHFYPK